MGDFKDLKREDQGAYMHKDDLGKYIVYNVNGIYGAGAPAVIFYRSSPSPEAMTLLEVSNSSRINPKEGETLLERILNKSHGLLEQYDEKETRERLGNIIYTLGSNNIKEQTHVLMAAVAPILTVMKIQDETIGFASQERSTRYVPFREFYIPKRLDGNEEAKELYTNAIAKLQEAYNSLMSMQIRELSAEYERKTGHAPTEKERKEVVVPTARDLCRGFVPLAAQSVVYISANAKNIENVVRRLRSTGSPTDSMVGALIERAMQDNVPSVSRHLDATEFSKALYDMTWSFAAAEEIPSNAGLAPFSKLGATIGSGSSTEEQILLSLEGMGIDEKQIEKLMNAREGKFDALNRTPLGIGSIHVNIGISLGSLRDLMRHRDTIKSYSIGHGYALPDALTETDGTADPVKLRIATAAFDYVSHAREKLIGLGFSDESMLLLPLATRCFLSMEMGFGEALYIAENRSTKEAHSEYRQIALQLFEELKERYPRLLEHAKLFVNESAGKFSRVEKEGAEKANRVLE